MVRTIVSMEEDLKRWLDRKAKRERVPMSRLVRRAIENLRRESEAASLPIERLLGRTRGTWRHGNGLAWQNSMRREWRGRG